MQAGQIENTGLEAGFVVLVAVVWPLLLHDFPEFAKVPKPLPSQDALGHPVSLHPGAGEAGSKQACESILGREGQKNLSRGPNPLQMLEFVSFRDIYIIFAVTKKCKTCGSMTTKEPICSR